MKKRNIIGYTLLFIAIFSYVLVLFYLNKIDIIPIKYCYIFSFIESFIIMFCLIFNKVKNFILNYISIFIVIVIIIINSFGLYYTRHIDLFLDNNFTSDIIRSNTYYLLTSKNNGISKYEEMVSNSNVYCYSLGSDYNKATSKVGNYNYSILDNLDEFFIDSLNNDNYLLIEKNIYNMILNENKEYDSKNYKIVLEFDINSSLKRNEELKDAYTILITGKDFSGANDFNMLVVINTRSREIMLLSIVRDYNIPVYGTSTRDNVPTLNLYGADIPRKSIGEFFGVDIDFVLDFDTTDFVKIIDKIGGLNYCSPTSYYTSHAVVLGTYNDSGKKLRVKSGCFDYSGIEILTIIRERIKIDYHENQRQLNCRKVLKAVVEKILSQSNLLNYTSVLDSFDGLYDTDLNRKTITSLVRSLLSNDDYKIYEYLATGKQSRGWVLKGTKWGWPVTPDENQVKEIKAKIQEVLNNK